MIHLDEKFAYQSASGSAVSFDTNTEQLLRRMEIGIEARQSGTGDPSPDNIRPINGYTECNLVRTGFNVWDEDWESGSINTNGNNSTSTTRIRTKNYIQCLSDAVYYARTNDKMLGMRFYDINKEFCGSEYNITVTDSTFTTPITAKYFRFSVVDTTEYGNDICINFSNPATNGAYESYQGDRFPFVFPSYTLDSSYITRGYYSQSKVWGANNNYITYTINLGAGIYTFRTDLDTCYILRYFIDDAYTNVQAVTNETTFTMATAGTFIICIRKNPASNISSLVPDSSISSAVYGGTLNALTGELTVAWKQVTVNDFSWTYNSTYQRFSATIPDIAEPGSARATPLYCSAFLPIDDGRAIGEVPANSIYSGGTSAHYVYIHNSDYTTGEAFKTAFADVQIVYPLKDPIVYQLTGQEITTLIGQNNIITDTNGILTCEYPVSLGDPYQVYFNAVQNGNPQHIRVTFMMGNMVFEDKDFTDTVQITTYMNPDIDLTFGTAFSSEANLTFIQTNKTNQVDWRREFKIEFGIETAAGTDWTQIGIFSGKRPLLDSRGVIRMTAYDRMQRFDKDAADFLDLMTFPCTLQELFDALCDFVLVESTEGDEIQAVMGRTIPADWNMEGISTCRDLLFLIAEANGCYARITPDGYLQFKWFENHRNDFELKRDNIFSFETTNLQQFDGMTWGDLSNYTWKQIRYFKWKEFFNKVTPFVINQILAKWAENGDIPKQEVLQPPEGQQPTAMTWDDADELTWDEFDEMVWDEVEGIELKGTVYVIEDNPFIRYDTEADIRAHLQLIVDRIKHFNLYYVAAVNAVGNWIVEAGDVISLELADGVVIYPIFSRTIYWNGSCECDYESTGNIIRGEE